MGSFVIFFWGVCFGMCLVDVVLGWVVCCWFWFALPFWWLCRCACYVSLMGFGLRCFVWCYLLDGRAGG